MIANLARLRETAMLYGAKRYSMEIDPATVNGLLDIAAAAQALIDDRVALVDGDFEVNGEDVAHLEDALSVFENEVLK